MVHLIKNLAPSTTVVDSDSMFAPAAICLRYPYAGVVIIRVNIKDPAEVPVCCHHGSERIPERIPGAGMSGVLIERFRGELSLISQKWDR